MGIKKWNVSDTDSRMMAYINFLVWAYFFVLLFWHWYDPSFKLPAFRVWVIFLVVMMVLAYISGGTKS